MLFEGNVSELGCRENNMGSIIFTLCVKRTLHYRLNNCLAD